MSSLWNPETQLIEERMTVGEKIEQFFTGRPNSYVPGATLERLLGLAPRSEDDRFGINMAMHYGQGAVAAIIRACMSIHGIRGPFADFMFVGIRLTIDQTLENWTGVGAPPWCVSLTVGIYPCTITDDCVGHGQSMSR
jgi:hypothetical protein